MKESFLIIDGLNYLFRAYFGLTDAIKTKSWVSVNAVYGFFAFLRKAVTALEPKYLLIIFDSENAASNKQQQLDTYKANRVYEDLGMFPQLEIIKEILWMMNITYLEEDSIEADDLIWTYSHFWKKNNLSTYISSNDFDFMQLISEDIFVLRTVKSDQVIFTDKEVIERFWVSPEYYPDYASLLGDKSDNIQWVSGIWKKTAKDIITKFSSIENLLTNIHDLPEKLKSKIEENRDRILLNKKMIVINQKVVNDLRPLDDFNFNRDGLNVKTSSYVGDLHI